MRRNIFVILGVVATMIIAAAGCRQDNKKQGFYDNSTAQKTIADNAAADNAIADNAAADNATAGNAVADNAVANNEAAERDVTREKKGIVLYEIPARLNDRPEQIIRRKGYTTSYNSMTKTANWVAWHLTKSHTYGSVQRSNMVFTEDTDVRAPRATDADYYNSRYDRGHLCPAGDCKWDAQAMQESFLFTNICPQNHGLNKYEWNDLEILCRDWAREYGAIDIVCGPLFDSYSKQKGEQRGGQKAEQRSYQNGEQKTIGRNRVWVPERLFKVVLCRQGSPKAIGFIYNNVGKKQPMREAVHSVDEIEALTGIDFFPALDDRTENRIEAKASLADW